MKMITLFSALALSAFGMVAAEPQSLALGHYEGTNDSGENTFDASALNMSPVAWTHVQSGSQTIYEAKDLSDMLGAEITSVSFKFYHNGFALYEDYRNRMRVYLQEIDVDNFQKNESDDYLWFSVEESAPNADFEWTWTSDDIFASSGMDYELVLPLTKPYTYKGKHLLVTVAQDNLDDKFVESMTTLFYWCDTKPTYCTAVYGSDKGVGFFESMGQNPVIYQSNSLMMQNAPAIRFEYVPAESSSVSAGVGSDDFSVTGVDGGALLDLSQTSDVAVYNVTGQVCYHAQLAAGSHRMELPAGIYIILVNSNNSKFIVH